MTQTNIEQDRIDFEAKFNPYLSKVCWTGNSYAPISPYDDAFNAESFNRLWEGWQAALKLTRERQASSEAVAWESITDAYKKYITQERYEKFSENVKRWYRPYKCANCTAPQHASLS